MRSGTAVLAACSIVCAIAARAADPSTAQDGSSPYGSAKAESYADIDSLKQLKAVYEFFFTDPKSVDVVLNSVKALMIATADSGPNDFEPLKIVIVSHGPELVVWDRKNYAKYKEVVDRAASLSTQGVRFEVCRSAAAALGLKPEDLHGFLHVIPSGPYALTYWQNKGYALILGGATQITKFVTPQNRADVRNPPD
jgi:uncharacterized protein